MVSHDGGTSAMSTKKAGPQKEYDNLVLRTGFDIPTTLNLNRHQRGS